MQKLFDCKFANVQPHSGAQAMVLLLALLKPVTLFSDEFKFGGHLTHGAKPAQSGNG